VLVSAIEHHAVLESAEWLAEHEGAQVELLPVDGVGRVHPETLRAALAHAPERVALVSVMWANNEVGTVNPVRELAAVAHEHGVPLHTDAVQAVGILPVDFAASGVDALTLTGHKLGGPYGAGALLLGREVALTPLLHGGGQERDVRSGTLDTPAVLALAAAVEIAVDDAPRRAAMLAGLRDDLVGKILATVPDARINGDPATAPIEGGPSRLPGNAHLSFPGCEGDSLLMLLDAQGIECSTGSACTAGVAQPSHVLLAMGTDEATARGSLRFSLGHTSTPDDIDAVAAVIGQVVERARRAGQQHGGRVLPA
jgi:cysteine desulfurase